jgi:hypothetical protein
MASHILGITGRKRSGKDTFAARLISHHGFTRVAFADPLKAVARDLDPMVEIPSYDAVHIRLSEVLGPDVNWETAKELPEVRRLLQALGVAVRKHVGEDAWVAAAITATDAIPGPVVITDVRFPNEAECVWQEGGWIARILRPSLPADDLHISETALDSLTPDYAISNGGTVEQLHTYADKIATAVLGV